MAKKIKVESNILKKNNLTAEENKKYFRDHNLFVLNLVSSPGSGKTTLIEKTIEDLQNKIDIYVIEGDQQTSRDAERIKKAGAEAVQINTGKACHLNAVNIKKAVDKLKPSNNSLVIIENVGNLICPSMFDLGENLRVVIISVTEGEDKPIKYPNMFHSSDLCLVNKIDLLPFVEYDIEQTLDYCREVKRDLDIMKVAAINGEGMQKWYKWIADKSGLFKI
ncbi:hydrogenase nickel incorporation protein HypB [Candidatus Dojkabacteria bacterium]|nr:hydrogenase nickel incorporation protein HypB [Candidatus Dojkabacteria bacterium]